VDIKRLIKSADFICQQNCLTKICHVIAYTKKNQLCADVACCCCCWVAVLLAAAAKPRMPGCVAGDDGLDSWLLVDRAEMGEGLWMEWTLCRLWTLCEPTTYSNTAWWQVSIAWANNEPGNSTGPLFERPTIPKVRYSESPLCRYTPQC